MTEIIQDDFQTAQENYTDYPASNTVVRTAIFGHSLDSFLKRLKEKNVFHDTYRQLGFVDLHEGSQGKPTPCAAQQYPRLTTSHLSVQSNSRYRHSEKA